MLAEHGDRVGAERWKELEQQIDPETVETQ
jgi:hypothetical protein